jgi:histidine triad (HIT) family protein
MVLAQRLAAQEGSSDGFRTIVNTGRIGRQDVMHVHVHVIGGAEVLPPMLVRK